MEFIGGDFLHFPVSDAQRDDSPMPAGKSLQKPVEFVRQRGLLDGGRLAIPKVRQLRLRRLA